MYGTVKEIQEPVKKISVDFKEEVMEVFLMSEGRNYLITVLNANCQAYCKKQKRVRQLNSGDEKLVINLINDRKEEILQQIKSCGG